MAFLMAPLDFFGLFSLPTFVWLILLLIVIIVVIALIVHGYRSYDPSQDDARHDEDGD